MKFDKMPYLTEERQIVQEIECISSDLEDIASDVAFILLCLQTKSLPISPLDYAYLIKARNSALSITENIKEFTLLVNYKKDVVLSKNWDSQKLKVVSIYDDLPVEGEANIEGGTDIEK